MKAKAYINNIGCPFAFVDGKAYALMNVKASTKALEFSHDGSLLFVTLLSMVKLEYTRVSPTQYSRDGHDIRLSSDHVDMPQSVNPSFFIVCKLSRGAYVYNHCGAVVFNNTDYDGVLCYADRKYRLLTRPDENPLPISSAFRPDSSLKLRHVRSCKESAPFRPKCQHGAEKCWQWPCSPSPSWQNNLLSGASEFGAVCNMPIYGIAAVKFVDGFVRIQTKCGRIVYFSTSAVEIKTIGLADDILHGFLINGVKCRLLDNYDVETVDGEYYPNSPDQ